MSEGDRLQRFAYDRLGGVPVWVVLHIIRQLGLAVSRFNVYLDEGQQTAIMAEWHRIIADHADVHGYLLTLQLESSRRMVRSVIPAGLLLRRTTIEEVEDTRLGDAEDRERKRELAGRPAPKYPQCGCMDWTALRELMQSGDELWSYRSPADTWRQRCGLAGYAVVRSGQVVGSMVTEMN